VSRTTATLLLLLAALIWGAGFLAQKHAANSIGPVSFVGVRFLLSWALLAPLAFYEHRKKKLSSLSKGDFGLAALIGLCLFIGATLQQNGLHTTTATNGGFLTALSVILVPLILWATTGARPKAAVFAGAVLCLAGSWLVTAHGHFQQWTTGDALVLTSDVAWACVIILTPLFLQRIPRPFFLAFMQFGVAALFGLAVGVSVETLSAEKIASALPFILYAGAVSGALAFTLQIMAQKHLPATDAAVILSLESVFAALAGALLLSERLTSLAAFGCALILFGVILAETGPSARAVFRRARPLGASGPTPAGEELAIVPTGADPG
jgi:drug/metabolite transporter (DMT)-like permease